MNPSIPDEARHERNLQKGRRGGSAYCIPTVRTTKNTERRECRIADLFIYVETNSSPPEVKALNVFIACTYMPASTCMCCYYGDIPASNQASKQASNQYNSLIDPKVLRAITEYSCAWFQNSDDITIETTRC
jgi:hypothetical protein